MINGELIGMSAAVLSISSFASQLFRTIKTRSAKDFSWGYLFFSLLATTLWLIYGIMDKSIPIIIANFFIDMVLIAVYYIKFTNKQ